MRVRKQTMNNKIQRERRVTFQDIKKDLDLWPIIPIQKNKRGTSLECRKFIQGLFTHFDLFESFNFSKLFWFHFQINNNNNKK